MIPADGCNVPSRLKRGIKDDFCVFKLSNQVNIIDWEDTCEGVEGIKKNSIGVMLRLRSLVDIIPSRDVG